MNNLQRIQELHKAFIQERNWDQFQTPKNLCMALSVEAAELVEIFMWLSDHKTRVLTEEQLEAASDEMADIFLYLLRIADVLGIDLIQATDQKMIKNAKKYSVEKGKALAEAFSDKE